MSRILRMIAYGSFTLSACLFIVFIVLLVKKVNKKNNRKYTIKETELVSIDNHEMIMIKEIMYIHTDDII